MKIRLTVLQGGTKGARIKIRSSPYVIGRGDDCQLKLNSMSVSRKHCVIIFRDNRVMIQDLGSRNGTVVRQQRLQASQACRLYHHDEIQVGKIRFRVSVRDSASNRPLHGGEPSSGVAHLSRVLPVTSSGKAVNAEKQSNTNSDRTPPKSAGAGGSVESTSTDFPSPEELLNELDSLVVQSETLGHSPAHQTPKRRRPEKDSSMGSGDSGTPELSDENSAGTDTTATLPEHMIDKANADAKSDGAINPAVSSGESTANSNSEGSKGDSAENSDGPQRLPNHLRPKRAIDSQDAASEALRRMFNR